MPGLTGGEDSGRRRVVLHGGRGIRRTDPGALLDGGDRGSGGRAGFAAHLLRAPEADLRDDADVDLAGVGRAKGLDDPVFDDSQEHRLDIERREADLVEEDAAAGGGPKVAGVVGSRAGESALLVAKKVGRRTLWSQHGHVDGDEWPVPAWTGGMQG